MSAPVIASRRTLHPGNPRPDRVATARAQRGLRANVVLNEGHTLYDALVAAFAAVGARNGALQLTAGALRGAFYHVSRPRADSERASEYGPALELPGGGHIVRANGSFGPDLHGRPWLHIHGALADHGGELHGGHLPPERCVVGAGGVFAELLYGIGFTQRADAETMFPLFFPVATATCVHADG